MTSTWDILWGFWDAGKVDPFALENCFPDFIKKIRAEGDRLQREGLEQHAIAVEYYEKLEAVKVLIHDIQGGGSKLREIADNFPDDMKGSMAKQYWNNPTFTYGIEYGALIILNHIKSLEGEG